MPLPTPSIQILVLSQLGFTADKVSPLDSFFALLSPPQKSLPWLFFYSISRSYPQLSCSEHTTLKVCFLFKQFICVKIHPLVFRQWVTCPLVLRGRSCSPRPSVWPCSAVVCRLSFHACWARGPCPPSGGLGTEPPCYSPCEEGRAFNHYHRFQKK